MKKHRLSVYLDADIMRALADYAARRDQSRSLIAEAAIASFLSPDAAERQEAATTKRLDQIDHCRRNAGRLHPPLADRHAAIARAGSGGSTCENGGEV
jgi:predicted transcriptional regulator